MTAAQLHTPRAYFLSIEFHKVECIRVGVKGSEFGMLKLKPHCSQRWVTL